MTGGMNVGSPRLWRLRPAVPVPAQALAQAQARVKNPALAQPYLLPAEDVVIHAIPLPSGSFSPRAEKNLMPLSAK